MEGHPKTERSGTAQLPLMVLTLVFLVLTVPVILTGRGGPSEASDQDNHHLVVIEQFRQQLPAIDVSDYPSATSPGYHAALALLGAIVEPPLDVLAMRLVNCLLGLGFVLVCWWVAQWYVSRWCAVVLVLPLVASPYVLGSSIWLTTDTAALFFVLLAMTSVMAKRTTPVRTLGCGFAAGCAVGIRQIHVWTAAPVGIVGVLASPLILLVPAIWRDTKQPVKSWEQLLASVAGASIPIVLLGWLVWEWGGVMPPAYVDMHNAGMNGATFAYALAIFGVLGIWYLPIVATDMRTIKRDRLVWVAMLIGLSSALVVPTFYEEQHRAYGALWRIVEMLPDIAGRSIVFMLAAPIGAAVLVVLYRSANRAGHGPRAAIVLLCVLGWLLAQSMNTMTWQRYFEPMTLVWLAWLVALAHTGERTLTRRWAGVFFVSVVLFGLSVASLYREVITSG